MQVIFLIDFDIDDHEVNQMAKLNILLVGPQGSGKSVQGNLISQKYSIPRISTGDILREHINGDTDLGRLVKPIMDKGELAPEEIVVKMVKERLSKPDAKNGYILDGFPRTISQAKALDTISTISIVVNLDLSDSEALKRISSRRICSKCGATFNIITFSPKDAGICDSCSGTLIQRDDDKASAVKKRLKTFHESTSPILKHYGKIVATVDGAKSVESVFNNIVKAIETLRK